ncbi:nuclear transport factor 2 family protein [Kutzneria sp. CA-103260]|uniref:nuclear transport factor 2 family protein n=1 Tax=Kutzneria sp. CA-103260 TaxID=2802641 RepID=UPI001BAD3F8B|nr:nuclear transport factor 2 family protein [Kutzneria sp. CA-103260]QUQ68489.1 ketosteroid isomerase-related protein [Kutzneria sp. CA-103260]
MTTPAEVFHRLLDGVTGRKWDELPLLYAEDAVVVYPFTGARLSGRSQIREHFAAAATRGVDLRAEDVVVHETTDPELVIGEFVYRGRRDGRDIDAPRIFVMRIRDGLIVESRDYGNG